MSIYFFVKEKTYLSERMNRFAKGDLMGAAEKISKQLLIIEDETEISEMYEEVITGSFPSAEINVTVAPNGEEGLNKMDEKKYDFIISDINMPKKDGITALEEAAKKGTNKDTPIVVVSGFLSMAEQKFTADEFQKTIFIDKPFKFDKLVRLAAMAFKLKPEA